MWCLWARTFTLRTHQLEWRLLRIFGSSSRILIIFTMWPPRLNQILVNRVRVTFAYFACSEILDDNFRLGRTWSRSLTETDHDFLEVFLICCASSTICQKYVKRSWSCQTKVALKIKYKTNVKSWTCIWILPSPCAQNILSRQFHLLPFWFWREVHRRRVFNFQCLAIYQHPVIVQNVIDGNSIKSVDVDMMDPEARWLHWA